jgi:hypothetical protein
MKNICSNPGFTNSTPGNPAPGSAGGGGAPVASSAASSQALALAPPGTVPVAVFPPYATPRTKPAVSVIFAEDAAMLAMNRAMMRFRRSAEVGLLRGFRRRGRRRPSYISSVLGRAGYASRQISLEHLIRGNDVRVT